MREDKILKGLSLFVSLLSSVSVYATVQDLKVLPLIWLKIITLIFTLGVTLLSVYQFVSQKNVEGEILSEVHDDWLEITMHYKELFRDQETISATAGRTKISNIQQQERKPNSKSKKISVRKHIQKKCQRAVFVQNNHPVPRGLMTIREKIVKLIAPPKGTP